MALFVDGKDVNIPPQWNLMTGTSTFNGFAGFNKNVETTDIYGNQQYKIADTWTSPIKLVPVFAGQVLCFSAVIKAVDSNALPALGIYGGDSKGGGTAGTLNNGVINDQLFSDNISYTNIIPLKDTNFHVVSGYFKITRDGMFNPRVECNNKNPWLISSYKLEVGTTKTPWLPAISDLTLKS